MSPEETLSLLLEGASTRTRKSLQAVYETCLEQKNRASTNFSYSMIARLGAVYGGPSYQTIKNSGGAKYRTLIKAFSDQVPPEPKPVSGPYSWIDELNGRHQLLARGLLAQLKAEQRKTKELLPPNAIYDIDVRTAPSATFKLTESERDALEYLSSDLFLSEHNLKRGPRSDILGPNDEQLFWPGTLAALEKALRNL
ncbi:gamma-mobile-trio protein GmtX [Pseudomonas sp. PNPG3]|uniref:gamma-mobile-trio protein GmtX n=1 Tax=Pseudomonas sp. PNPG3 TaxID=2919497 RepID=UPI001FFCAFE7|nr:gamma-mobile-trio protein GmtX [Pseudomonas sp. PNPG3]MCK2124710.1 gamma-mobile-trio protein GmtX [Pseudomonas sp. PNPG3]